MAITQSPMRMLRESPNLTAFNGVFGSTFKTERSVFVSVPTSVALSFEPLGKITSMASAPSMTWLLVTT
ncbi:hypothetical protein D3C86_1097200 [compost metagenome]